MLLHGAASAALSWMANSNLVAIIIFMPALLPTENADSQRRNDILLYVVLYDLLCKEGYKI